MAFSQFYETADSKCRKQLWSILNLNDYTSHLPIDASLVISIITTSMRFHYRMKKITLLLLF